MERDAYDRGETSAFAVPSPVELPGGEEARHLDHVPEWVLPTAYTEIGIGLDPTEVAAEQGIDSEEVAVLCDRGYVRVATTALHRTASEAVRRLWDTLETIDGRAVRQFPDHDRETYHRDKAAWRAVFYEHVQRQTPGPRA